MIMSPKASGYLDGKKLLHSCGPKEEWEGREAVLVLFYLSESISHSQYSWGPTEILFMNTSILNI